MNEKKCANCRFWSQENTVKGQGQCRIGAPVVFPIPSQLGSLQFVSTWPGTQADQWCGKMEPQEPHIQ
jgi:hypothetical protein